MRLLATLALLLSCPFLNGCRAADEPPATEPTTSPQVTLTVRMGGAGVLTVHQDVHFSEPSYSLSLSPDPPEISVGDEERFRPLITHVTAQAPGQPDQHVRRVDYDSRWVSFTEPVREVTLDYRMRGVMAHQRPSVPGRFLVYVTALSVGPVDGAERVVTVEGALNLGCLNGDGELDVCGRQTEDGWTVRLPPDRAATSVLAQVQAT